MSLRTKIIVWFLLLSVVPLAAIVSYSYLSSNSALRRAVLSESWEMAAGLRQQMESTRQDLRERVEGLHGLPWESLLEASVEGGTPLYSERFEEMLVDLAPFVDTLEFIPSPPEVSERPEPQAPPVAPTPGPASAPTPTPTPSRAPSAGVVTGVVATVEGFDEFEEFEFEPLVIELESFLHSSEEDLEKAWKRDDLLSEVHASALRGVDVDIAADALSEVRRSLEALELTGERTTSEEAKKKIASIRAKAFKRLSSLREEEVARRKELRERSEQVMGASYDCPVEIEGETVGSLRASVLANRVVSQVLSETDRGQGEIPFAFDRDDRIYLAQQDDLAALERAGLVGNGRYLDAEASPDYVVAYLNDEESDLTFGIARPIRESVRELRRTAGRNFGLGFGLVGLALIGVVPLSRRITRDLEELTAGSEHIASGNWDVRVPVRSRDEVGQLAQSFNRMAGELVENQQRLVDTQLQQQLLEVENERRGRELEEARQFQLSLLPKDLPRHPDLEVAVFMRTATEVGGDYYDFKLEEEGALTAVIGDATGHGAKAGTMVTVIKSLFTAWWGGDKLVRFLDAAADSIRAMRLGRMAMALMLARIDGRRLTVSSAGMPPLLICRAGGAVEEVALSGLPLGGMANPSYDERQVELSPGDTILLLSDGLPELPNAAGEPFGYERVHRAFERACAETPQGVIEKLAAAAREWAPGAPADDITFVVLRLET